MSLVILTKSCKVYLTFQTCFMIAFELFTSFNTFLIQMLIEKCIWNVK